MRLSLHHALPVFASFLSCEAVQLDLNSKNLGQVCGRKLASDQHMYRCLKGHPHTYLTCVDQRLLKVREKVIRRWAWLACPSPYVKFHFSLSMNTCVCRRHKCDKITDYDAQGLDVHTAMCKALTQDFNVQSSESVSLYPDHILWKDPVVRRLLPPMPPPYHELAGCMQRDDVISAHCQKDQLEAFCDSELRDSVWKCPGGDDPHVRQGVCEFRHMFVSPHAVVNQC